MRFADAERIQHVARHAHDTLSLNYPAVTCGGCSAIVVYVSSQGRKFEVLEFTESAKNPYHIVEL